MTDPFERVRDRLWGLAYRMLGVPDDADDVVQEAQLRWLEADQGAVRDPEGWLVVVATRLAIDRLRRAERERREYVGPWVPVPRSVGPSDWSLNTSPDRAAELASDLSLAFLYLLERLEPEERAAFLLRDVFDVAYARISEVLDRSEAACRQMVHRARGRLRDGPARRHATPLEQRELARRFVRAVETDDLDTLVALLAPEATHVTDGGGKAWAALRVIHGADAVARGMLGAFRKAGGEGRPTLVVGTVNGSPAVLGYMDGRLVSASVLSVADGRASQVLTILNPDKLPGHGTGAPTSVARRDSTVRDGGGSPGAQRSQKGGGSTPRDRR